MILALNSDRKRKEGCDYGLIAVRYSVSYANVVCQFEIIAQYNLNVLSPVPFCWVEKFYTPQDFGFNIGFGLHLQVTFDEHLRDNSIVLLKHNSAVPPCHV